MSEIKNENDLVAVINEQINNAVSGQDSDIESSQSDALDRYYGRPMGNEIDGRSRVVTRDLLETIEWMIPNIIKPFISGKEYIAFDPVNSEDIKKAEQETKAVNHVIQKKNNGFMILHDWIKDGLLMKNGYVKVEVQDYPVVKYEQYRHLTNEEMTTLLVDSEVEAVEHLEYVEDVDIGGQLMPVTFNDVKVKYTENDVRLIVMNIPNEEMIVSRDTVGAYLNDSQFVAHKMTKTQGELVEAGYEGVGSLPGLSGYEGELSHTRETHTGEDSYLNSKTDDSTRKITVYDAYIRYDLDGDGVSELVHVVMAGDKILDIEEAAIVPFASWTPIPMPHKHIGLSEDDLLKDIQAIKTTLTRQMLDNIYLSNSPRPVYLEGKVNLSDLLNHEIGSPVAETYAGAVRFESVPFTAGASLEIMGLIDQNKESRTGVSRHTMGLDANALAQSTKGAFEGALQQANHRLEMVARLFAEQGLKELFRIVHAMLSMHRDTEMIMDLNGEYTPINPAQWRERTDLTVKVGLGTSRDEDKMARLSALIDKAEQHIMNGSPVFSATNVHEMYKDLTELSGIGRHEEYLTDPRTVTSPPPKPDPLMLNFELEKHKANLQHQYKMQELKLSASKQNFDNDFKDREVRVKEDLADLEERKIEGA